MRRTSLSAHCLFARFVPSLIIRSSISAVAAHVGVISMVSGSVFMVLLVVVGVVFIVNYILRGGAAYFIRVVTFHQEGDEVCDLLT